MLKKLHFVILVFSLALFSCSKSSSVFVRSAAPSSSFSLFTDESQVSHSIVSAIDHLTGAKGQRGVWGDGIFSYGLWDYDFSDEVEEAHFKTNEVEKKVFVSRDLRDLLVLQVLELNVQNFLEIPKKDYELYKNLPTIQDKIFWFLNYESTSLSKEHHPIATQIKKICYYSQRQDVFVLHIENFIDPSKKESQIQQLKDLALFLNASSDLDEKALQSILRDLENAAHLDETTGLWKKYFTPEIQDLFFKKMGSCQTRIGYLS